MSKASSMEAASQIAANFSHTIYVGPQHYITFAKPTTEGARTPSSLIATHWNFDRLRSYPARSHVDVI
jgi:hypothetical protein